MTRSKRCPTCRVHWVPEVCFSVRVLGVLGVVLVGPDHIVRGQENSEWLQTTWIAATMIQEWNAIPCAEAGQASHLGDLGQWSVTPSLDPVGGLEKDGFGAKWMGVENQLGHDSLQ